MKNFICIHNYSHETRVAHIESGQLAELVIDKNDASLVGRIFKGVVRRTLSGMDCAFVDIGLSKAAFLLKDAVVMGLGQSPDLHQDKIHHLLQPGQEVIVQVKKDPLGNKGPAISMQVSLAGSYLVLVYGGAGVFVSRRIEREEKREALKKIIEPHLTQGFGVIVRTASEEVEEAVLTTELRALIARWKDLKKRSQYLSPLQEVFEEGDFFLRMLNRLASKKTEAVFVGDEKTYEILETFLRERQHFLLEKIHLYRGDIPLFEHFQLENAIARALEKKVILPSGAYLYIETTEALTSIDVNSGSYIGVGKASHEASKLAVNLEAATHAMQQIRLRNISGIIIIDFIDMKAARDREKVLEVLRSLSQEDRARIHILKISEMGLAQMTRKREAPSLEQSLMQTCTNCSGHGKVWAPEMAARRLLGDLQKRFVDSSLEEVRIRVSPALAAWFQADGVKELLEVEKIIGQTIEVEVAAKLDLVYVKGFEIIGVKQVTKHVLESR